MNSVSIFDRKCVAEIQTGQRRMLEYQVKDLLLKLAAIDTIVLDRDGDEALVVNNSIE